MARITETGHFFGRIPFARISDGAAPILVVPGGHAFVQRPSPERVARDARRIAHLLPRDRSFILLGFDVDQPDLATSIPRDIAAIIAELGGRLPVLAISYGGVMALRVACEYPERIEKLALVVSAHDFSAEGKARIERQIAAATRGDFVALTEQFAAVFRRPWLNWLLRWRLRRSRDRLAQVMNEPSLIVRGLASVLEHPLDPARLVRATMPCLVVGGSADQFFGGMFERTAELLPNATLCLIAGETHMVPVERRREVARAVRALFANP